VGSAVRVKRRFSTATGCSVRLSSQLRAGADATVAARGMAGGRRRAQTRRRAAASVDGRGGQAMRGSNS